MASLLLNPSLQDAQHRVWWVEKQGKVFARLEDARFADMFWVAYRVVDLTRTEQERAELYSKKFWHDGPLPKFRHVKTGAVVETAFAGGQTPTAEDPLVWIRALHPPPEPRAATKLFQSLCRWTERLLGAGTKKAR